MRILTRRVSRPNAFFAFVAAGFSLRSQDKTGVRSFVAAGFSRRVSQPNAPFAFVAAGFSPRSQDETGIHSFVAASSSRRHLPPRTELHAG